MGSRRMFSLKIINSAKFLKMPNDVQNLYFHLGLRADDDGIVEAFSVMRLIGANDDSLKLLHAKGFVYVLNDDYVTYIVDWLEHNVLRADRKIDSIYKDLLVQILPEIKLLEPKQRADRQYKQNKEEDENTSIDMDVNGTSQGQTLDGLSKVKLSKDKLSKDKKDICEIENFFESVWSLYPNKKGKTAIKTKQKQTLFQLGFETLSGCIERYKTDKPDWQAWKNGSTFFNGAYTDYLIENFHPTPKDQGSSNKQPDNMTNYEQREYTDEYYDSLYDNVWNQGSKPDEK